MPAARTSADPLQSTSNRALAKHLLKRMAPGLLAVGGVGTVLLLGATAVPAALQAMA